MLDEETKTNEDTITPDESPEAELLESMSNQIDDLEKQLRTAQAELAKRETEALGIAWCDLYGAVIDDTGGYHIMKVSLTSRSNVSPSVALRELLTTVKEAQDYNLHPFAIQPGKTAVKSAQAAQQNTPQYQPAEELP